MKSNGKYPFLAEISTALVTILVKSSEIRQTFLFRFEIRQGFSKLFSRIRINLRMLFFRLSLTIIVHACQTINLLWIHKKIPEISKIIDKLEPYSRQITRNNSEVENFVI